MYTTPFIFVMRPQTIFILPLVLLYFASAAKTSNIRTITFNRTYEHDQTLVHDRSRQKYARDASWTYASCDFDRNKCSVVFETNNPDGRVYREICRIFPEAIRHIGNHIRVFQFGRNKAIVVWHGINNIAHFTTVHFPTCKVSETTMVLESLFDMVDVYRDNVKVLAKNNDKYDVFYVNSSTDTGFSLYRVTFDESSRILEGPTEMVILPGNPNVHLDYPIPTAMMPETPKNHLDYPIPGNPKHHLDDPIPEFIEADPHFDIIGHVMITPDYQNSGVTTFWKLGNHSEKTEWMSFEQGLHDIVLSTANNIIGICHYYNTNRTFTCEQRNSRREKLLSFDFETGYEIAPRSYLMHNLPRGGFLMFVWPCPDCENERKLHVTKVSASGKRYRTLELMDYPENRDRVRDGFFENGVDEYCWYQLIAKDYKIYKGAEPGFTYEITYVCFTEEHLSESYSF